MKTLYSHLNESVLDNIDDQVEELDIKYMIRELFAEYIINVKYYEKENQERLDKLIIDTKKHTIDVSRCCRYGITISVDKESKPFPGFPIGYTLIGGPNLHDYYFIGPVDSIRGIPTDDPKLSLYFNHKYQEPCSFSKNIEKELGSINKAKKITIDIDNQKIDLSNLNCRLNTLGLSGGNTIYTFNENMRVELLSLDYKCTPTNLPSFGTLTWRADYDKIVKDIQGMTSTGKSNFDKIKIQNRDLSDDQKENIRKILKGESIDNSSRDPQVIRMDLNNIFHAGAWGQGSNETDSTKDFYGQPLNTGDIVICNGVLDIFVRTAGSRIKTIHFNQAKPKDVIKLNNPDLIKLMDKYKLLEK